MADEAVTALERAVAILEEDFESTESAEIEQRYSMGLCNLGRVLLATGQYQSSLDAYSNCWELDPATAALRVQVKLGQGLAHYWLGQIDESLEAFEESLAEADKAVEGLKEEVAVLLSRTLWGLGGEDAKEAAKTHLLEWYADFMLLYDGKTDIRTVCPKKDHRSRSSRRSEQSLSSPRTKT